MNEAEIVEALKVSAAQRKFDPMMAEFLRLQNAAAQQAAAAPDTGALERAGFDRERQGQERQLGGMMLATGLPQFQNIAPQTYRQGLEETQPFEMGEGYYMPGSGYVQDPVKRGQRLTKALAAQAAAAREAAGAYGQEEQRSHTRQVQDEELKLKRLELQSRLAAGKLLAFKGQNDEPYFMDVRTRQVINPLAGVSGGAAQPGAYPQQASHRATEDERKTAYQTQATATRAGAIDPNYARPGFFESAARTLMPGAPGEAAANWLSPGPRQVTRQAQEGVVDSLLYLATGAAYNKEQLAQARNEFLPGFSDKPETVTAKTQRVAQLAEAARNRAGRAWTQAQENQLQAAFPELGGGARPPAAPAGGAARSKTIGGRQYFKGPDGNWYTP
jgi:hypothetical protein